MRCTARSVTPTRRATSRRVRSPSAARHTSTCVWLLRKVQPGACSFAIAAPVDTMPKLGFTIRDTNVANWRSYVCRPRHRHDAHPRPGAPHHRRGRRRRHRPGNHGRRAGRAVGGRSGPGFPARDRWPGSLPQRRPVRLRPGGDGRHHPARRAAQGPHHHAPGRRLQERQRKPAQVAGAVRQPAPVRGLPPLHRHPPPGHGRGDRARERRGHLRRHRAPPERGGLPVPEADHAPGLRAHRALCLRIRAQPRPPQAHLHDQGQHHEAHRRPVPPGLRRDRRRISRAGGRAHDH